MKSSRRELSINMVIDGFILKNSQITLFPLPSCSKQVWDYLKQELFFTVFLR